MSTFIGSPSAMAASMQSWAVIEPIEISSQLCWASSSCSRRSEASTAAAATATTVAATAAAAAMAAAFTQQMHVLRPPSPRRCSPCPFGTSSSGAGAPSP